MGPVVGAGEHSLGRSPTGSLRWGQGLEHPQAGGLRWEGCFSDLLPGLNSGQACAKTSAPGGAPFGSFSAHAPAPRRPLLRVVPGRLVAPAPTGTQN